MITRRNFLKAAGVTIAASSLMPEAVANSLNEYASPSSALKKEKYPSQRPALEERLFKSNAVEYKLDEIVAKLTDEKLAWMFSNCFPNTLDTTVHYRVQDGRPDTFVYTGDIHAMWLRDSAAQVFPYLPLMRIDGELQKLIAGVINRQTKCILFDPYANAYNDGPGKSEWLSDFTDMKPELHERKWEIDSLCYPVRLAYHYWKHSGDTSIFDKNWQKAAELILKTFKEQQRKKDLGPYKFQRRTERASDTLYNDGYNAFVNPVGLIVSAFRPSDDATLLNFLVPSNLFAVTSLRQLAEISETVTGEKGFARKCSSLADEVDKAIKKHAIHKHPKFGNVYAFEVDGYGGRLFMDDANVPSLLALPYLGCVDVEDKIYQNTRKMIWSEHNPYFFKGSAAEGIGGPHIGLDMVWPMSIIMKAMTSTNDKEIAKCVKMLRDCDGGTGFMHESFHKDDPKNFTRKWFAWANTLFGELIIKLVDGGKLELLNNL